MFKLLKERMDQVKWYREKHGVSRLARLTLERFIDRWVVRSKYLFVVNLGNRVFKPATPHSRFKVEAFSSITAIPKVHLDELRTIMGPGRALRFLHHFFGYGARLWLATQDARVVGVRWTLHGGFSGFFCMPIQGSEVVTLADQVFEPFRGQGLWGAMNETILGKLKEEGVSRVYFGVHCRNRSMLRAARKANIQVVGRVLTFSMPRYEMSFWRRRYLWGGDDMK